MSTAMGKGDWLHTLAQHAQRGSWVLGASTSKDLHPASRMGWREILLSDVDSPVGELFWGREREPLTLAWSHTLASASRPALLLTAPGMEQGLFQGMWCW